MKIIKNIPLFFFMFLFYNVVVFSAKLGSSLSLETQVFAMPLLSGPLFVVNVGEMLLIAGVAMLYIEIFKATRSSNASIFDHLFSMLTFVGFLVEFLLVPEAATSYFFTLLLMTFLDVIAGFTVTIATSRRDMDLSSR